MLKKDHDLKWSEEAKKAFTDIKQTLCQALVLVSPNYGKDFQLFSFASDYTMVVILLQKISKGVSSQLLS
jgi:hypothetical protein